MSCDNFYRDLKSFQISFLRQFCPLPELTEDNKTIIIVRTSDTSQYSCVDAINKLLLMLEARCAMLDRDRVADADILIIDLEKYPEIVFFISSAFKMWFQSQQ